MGIAEGIRSRRRGYLEHMGTNMGVAEGLWGGRRVTEEIVSGRRG
jgi:hypothetical protein